MRIVRQKTVHGKDAFRLRIWKKRVFVKGWHAEVQIGSREWCVFPSHKARERQIAEGRANAERARIKRA